jgi:hypothetical protein
MDTGKTCRLVRPGAIRPDVSSLIRLLTPTEPMIPARFWGLCQRQRCPQGRIAATTVRNGLRSWSMTANSPAGWLKSEHSALRKGMTRGEEDEPHNGRTHQQWNYSGPR